MKSSSSSTNCLITLVDTPINEKYTPLDNIVKTDIQIDFKAHEKICFINCGLLGSGDVSMTVKKKRYDPNKKKVVHDRTIIHDNHVFLNCETKFNIDEQFRNLNTRYKFETFTPPTGKILKKQFKFRIPNNYYLPSSFKSIVKSEGEYSITYQIYVEIYKLGGLINKKPKLLDRFTTEITYQSGSDHNTIYPKRVLNYEITQLFNNKVKKFYFDNELNALVPSSITKNHRKARFFIKIWNEDYRDSNYKNITKSIPLKLDFSVNSLFDMYIPITEQFNAVIIADLKSVGIDSNQTTDFVFNGQSTHLGVFKIVSLTIKFCYRTSIRCQDRYLKDENSTDLIDTKFDEITFDIKDFEFCRSTRTYNEELSQEKIIQTSEVCLRQSLMDLMKDKPFLCTGKVADWFDNTVNLKFLWTISDGMSQERTFEILTSSSPDISAERNVNNKNTSYTTENDDVIDASYKNNINMTYLNKYSYNDEDDNSSSNNNFVYPNRNDYNNTECYDTEEFENFNKSYNDSVEPTEPPAYTELDFGEANEEKNNNL